MKIAIASCGLGHITRGIEAWAHDTAHALHERGIDVILCKGGGEIESDFERVIPCLHRESRRTQQILDKLPKRGLWRVGISTVYDLEALSFTWNLIKVLRREKIDILHVQDPLIALYVQRAKKLKLVRTRAILGHGTNEPISFLKKIKYLQHLAPCHRERAAHHGASSKRWCAIPNFIDTSKFRPGRRDAMRRELGIPENAPVILSVAAIKKQHKRIDHLIREFALLRSCAPELNAYLIVAGGAEADTDELIDMGQSMLGSHFVPLVRFPRQRIPDLYRAADLFVLCSLREMMPIALLEAAATGLPCIVHSHPSLGWITGTGGRSIDMSSVGALAAAVRELCGSESLRADLGEQIRNHCEANFSKSRVVDQLLSYYRLVLSGNSNAPAPYTSTTSLGEPREPVVAA